MGNIQNEIALKEHRDDLNVNAKRVIPYGVDGVTAYALKVNSDGSLNIVDAGGVGSYDNVAFTYNADATVATMVYTLSGGGVATRTFSYNADGTISNIART